MMRIAVIGAGISGIAAAYELAKRHEVTLIEAAPRLGGHTDTHDIVLDRRVHRVDSGFIVFNDVNYPGFSAWLDELGVESQASDMSFGVSLPALGLEYGTRTLNALFADRANLVRPQFFAMLRELIRFYREAQLLGYEDAALSLGEYLQRHRYREVFVRGHLVPMCAALWSAPDAEARDLSIDHIVRFMSRHRMLELTGRPTWRVVRGGSATYVDAFVRRFRGEVLLSAPVQSIERSLNSVRIELADGVRTFDAVFLACHSDQALALLRAPTAVERGVLDAIPYRRNRV